MSTANQADTRRILALAGPAFLTLLAEPLFLLTDSAIVGHLGTVQLAALGVASSVLLTAAGIFVFLAYATTSLVARRIGAGDRAGALSSGVDGIWLAALIGVPTTAIVALAAHPLGRFLGAQGAVADEAAVYLRIGALGVPALLIVSAATGILRGFQDTRTPLWVTSVGFTVNAALNYLLVYPGDMGIAGAAIGTVVAQTGMAVVLVWVTVRMARAEGASMRFRPLEVLSAARFGAPLMVRTIALRAGFLTATWVAAGLGDVPLAAHQVAINVFTLLAFALDALAIAAQALIGTDLGAGRIDQTRAATRTMLRWGWAAGVVLGLITAALAWVLPLLFTPDPDVRAALTAALLVLAVTQPVAGAVFLLDGVLMGAGDNVVLAWLQVASLAAFLPFALWVGTWEGSAPVGLALLWAALAWFMLARLIGLWLRARSDAWMRVGA